MLNPGIAISIVLLCQNYNIISSIVMIIWNLEDPFDDYVTCKQPLILT